MANIERGGANAPTSPSGVIEQQAAIDSGVPPEEEPNVSPEEQAIYDTVVNNALTFIHGEESSQSVMNILNDKSVPPEQNVGKVVAQITKALQQSAEASGQEIPGDVLFHAGAEIAEEVVSLAVGAGIVGEDQAEDVLQKGFMTAVDLFGQASLQDGSITPEKMEQAKTQMAIGQQAENEGIDPVDAVEQGGANLQMNPMAAGVAQASRGGVLGAR